MGTSDLRRVLFVLIGVAGRGVPGREVVLVVVVVGLGVVVWFVLPFIPNLMSKGRAKRRKSIPATDIHHLASCTSV